MFFSQLVLFSSTRTRFHPLRRSGQAVIAAVFTSPLGVFRHISSHFTAFHTYRMVDFHRSYANTATRDTLQWSMLCRNIRFLYTISKAFVWLTRKAHDVRGGTCWLSYVGERPGSLQNFSRIFFFCINVRLEPIPWDGGYRAALHRAPKKSV